MVEYANKDLFLMDSVDKQLNISYDDGEITNSELASEDFTLVEKLTSNGTFVLGECNASYVEFSVGYGTEPIEGKELTIKITPKDAQDFQIGKYVVVNDKPTADRRWRKITAYDALYFVLNLDVTAWYDEILPEAEEGEDPVSITVKQFRDGFFSHVGITQEDVNLPNDSVVITRQVGFKQLSGKAVLNAICSFNGCFGRIDRTGIFRYVFLHATSDPMYPAMNLYPSDSLFPKFAGNPYEIGIGLRYKYPLPKILYPSNGLFPSEELFPVAYETEKLYGVYISAKYEDYFVNRISAIQIRNSQNDIGVTVGSGQLYVIEGNFLAYGLSDEVLTEVATNILNAVKDIYFCPADISAKGNLCLEIGDPIVLNTRYAKIETIIFQRKLKGIQSLTDTYTSKGAKDNKKNINSLQSQITQANGDINEVKADLITAKKVIAEEIEADRARIGYIEANYVQTETLIANYATIESLETVDAKIDNLTSIAITTQNLSAQTIYGNQISGLTISAGQITSGTISADRIDASVIRTKYLNACATDPHQGRMDIGVVRLSELWVWNGTEYERKF